MATHARARRNRGGRGVEGHQEHPSERLSADRPVRISAPCADESRHHPRLCDFETRLDQAAAEKAPRPGTRNARASIWTAKATTFGEALSSADRREEAAARGGIEAPHDGSAGSPGTGKTEGEAIVDEWYRDQIKTAVPCP